VHSEKYLENSILGHWIPDLSSATAGLTWDHSDWEGSNLSMLAYERREEMRMEEVEDLFAGICEVGATVSSDRYDHNMILN
jgi:hypothetical protein